MQKFATAIALLLSVLLLTGTSLRAELDVPWQWAQQKAICNATGDINALPANFVGTAK